MFHVPAAILNDLKTVARQQVMDRSTLDCAVSVCNIVLLCSWPSELGTHPAGRSGAGGGGRCLHRHDPLLV